MCRFATCVRERTRWQHASSMGYRSRPINNVVLRACSRNFQRAQHGTRVALRDGTLLTVCRTLVGVKAHHRSISDQYGAADGKRHLLGKE